MWVCEADVCLFLVVASFLSLRNKTRQSACFAPAACSPQPLADARWAAHLLATMEDAKALRFCCTFSEHNIAICNGIPFVKKPSPVSVESGSTVGVNLSPVSAIGVA